MANEIQIIHDDAAETVYATVRDSTGQWYAGSDAQTFAISDWATFDIALTEVSAATSGNVMERGTFPPVATGYYFLDTFVQSGAAPAHSDYYLGTDNVYWNGTALVPASSAIWTVSDRTLTAADNLNIPTSDNTAYAVLKTSASDVQHTAAPHSLTTVILGTTESSLSGLVWTVRKTDGTTFVTKTLTSDADAKPIVSVT